MGEQTEPGARHTRADLSAARAATTERRVGVPVLKKAARCMRGADPARKWVWACVAVPARHHEAERKRHFLTSPPLFFCNHHGAAKPYASRERRFRREGVWQSPVSTKL